MTLPVNEIFETIQGEGFHTGTPAVFIRLQGCDVGCPWCDTKHTWGIDATNERIPESIIAKAESGQPTWAMMTPHEIVGRVHEFKSRHVVITGGEPCMHDLTMLTGVLSYFGLRRQIETSGTYPVLCDERTWVTVSPKVGMPGGRKVLNDALDRADEIKMPIGKPADIATLHDLLGRRVNGKAIPIMLQPLSLSPRATELCVKAAIECGWRVSLQTHQLAQWR